MIKDWRTRWGHEFAFIGVQLAPFASANKPDAPQWAKLRKAQVYSTHKLPKVGLAVITDVGAERTISIPPRKSRSAPANSLLARKLAYGEPRCRRNVQIHERRGKPCRANFDSVGAGLETRGGKLTGSTVCGADGTFVPANAEIIGDKVAVWSDSVAKPNFLASATAVRASRAHSE